ncbi:putative hco3-transporter family protein [Coleophoma cylindrospora]|uniref:Putative hco3-transporter family protein n=1 Tax=Coleophoma cylindrospora TaxID=1849047 RepID=A0A3D8RAT9_9HELO|nr:putative hco3-transporter family protein [Coleophoma cylindrospora]
MESIPQAERPNNDSSDSNDDIPAIDNEKYRFDELKGWKSYRLLRPGRGIYHDLRRRLPYYASDITDAWNYRVIASTIRMYFVKRTGSFYGVNEALFSSALAAVVFSVLGAQPLTIVGITGLISLFNYTIYDIINLYEPEIYPMFMAWTAIWAAVFHWLVALANVCDYMRYVTDFSSEAFGMYVGIIYMIKGVEELVAQFTQDGPINGYASCMIAILYFGTIYGSEKIGAGILCKPYLRGFLADYAYVFGTIFWVGFSHIPGTLKTSHLAVVPISRAFHPTQPRTWLISFWELDIKWVFVAMPFGFLVMLLFYYDHNVSSITAQAKQFPLKKPGGFHWDFFLLGCTTFVAGILGLPLPNGLVPQAPVHTDSLTNYATHVQVIRGSSEDREDGPEIRTPIIVAESVVEQRVSHFLMSLALIGTMTGPLLIVLHTMPQAIFAGVFFVVGWASIETNGMTKKLLFLMTEHRFVSTSEPLLRVPRSKTWLFISLQALGVASTVAISQTIAAIGFPILICALIPMRVVFLPRLFSARELDVLDSLTANNGVVLASLGGRPRFKREKKVGVKAEALGA